MNKIKELMERKGKQLYERDVKCIPIKHPTEWAKLPEITRDGYCSQAKELLNDPELYLKVTGEVPIANVFNNNYYSVDYISLAGELD